MAVIESQVFQCNLLEIRMKIYYLNILLILSLFVLCGCTTIDVEKPPASNVTESFIQKKDYNVSYKEMWDTVMNVLGNEGISVESADISNGLINTDYIKGDQNFNIDRFGASGSAKRLKYSISLINYQSFVNMNIIATVEVLESVGGSGSGSWRPLGDLKEDKLHENWLYEKIEYQVVSQDVKTKKDPYDKHVITMAQEKLAVLGYDPGPADGITGKKTRDALAKFQQDNNLSVTGKVDKETLDKLQQK